MTHLSSTAGARDAASKVAVNARKMEEMMQQAMEEQERELAEGRRLRDEAQAASDLADSQMQAIADEKEAVRQTKIAKEAKLADK